MKGASFETGRIEAGTRLGPYEVVGFLGQGGMGEVYRARDTRLDRLVAIKILPKDSRADPGRRERFMREAWILSSLNHSAICAIHDIGEYDGRAFLVMEYVEGEPLDVKLSRRPLPIASAIAIAGKIAEALDVAHRRGFVHRDLKPANIIITSSGVKLVDFGIAHLWSEPLDPAEQSMATTASDAVPVPGTPAYMSPEQLEGRQVDPRSDLFALGVVLYEMLCGRRPFRDDPAGQIAGILERPPEPLVLPGGPPPPALDRIVRKCLEKDPDARWQNARDLAVELAWVQSDLEREVVPAALPRVSRRRQFAAAALLALAALATVALAWGRGDTRSDPVMVRFVVTPPAGIVMAGTAAFALSPDGRHLAFVGSTGGGPSLLWIQPLDSYAARPVPGTDDAWHPFWSPDSRSVGFFAGGKLKAASVDGGVVRTLSDVPQAGRASHGSWGRDVVLFNGAGTLWRIPAEGGLPVEVPRGPVVPPDAALFAMDFLPDGRHFLLRTPGGGPGVPNIFVASLDAGAIAPLLEAGSQVRYVDPGYLLYMRGGDLFMHQFDPRSRRLSGQPVHVPEPVAMSTRLGRAIFSSARRDVLAYEADVTPTELVWYDRFGRRLGTLGPPGFYSNPSLAPDGRRAAVTRFDPSVDSSDIWIVEEFQGPRALTASPSNEDYPVWSTNGMHVIYASDAGGPMRMYQKRADSTPTADDAAPLNDGAGEVDANWPLDWTPRGGFVIFQGTNAGIPRRLFALATVGRDRPVLPVVSTSNSTGVLQEEAQAQVSPDGRWMAYTADLGRSPQVYLKAFPSGGNVMRISTAGGFEPKWRGDGREIFYLVPNRTLMSVSIRCGATCEVEPPRPLFRVPALGAPLRKGTIRNEYAVARDGQRFLVNEPVDGPSAYGIRVVVNWQAGR